MASPHTLKLVDSADRADLYDKTKYILHQWQNAPYRKGMFTIDDTLRLTLIGATQTALYDNAIALYRALMDARANYDAYKQGFGYTPLFLRFKHAGSTHFMQSELLFAEDEPVENFISGALRANLIGEIQLTLKRRPYWEELSTQSLDSGTSKNNNGATLSITGARGDLPAPLQITARSTIALQDRLIVGIKWRGTVANFVCKYEAEDYQAKGTNCADLSAGAAFSGGAPDGVRWTPGALTADQMLVRWRNTTNVSDQLGTYRVFARVRDNAATPKVRIRLRAGVYDGSTNNWGDYADYPKYCVTGNTTIELVDLGTITFPPIETGVSAPNGLLLELHGSCDATPGTFDIDCLYLVPMETYEDHPGGCVATFSRDAGTGAAPDMVVDGNDRKPKGYLDSSGTILAGAADVRGGGLFIKPNTTAALVVLTQDSGTGAHDFTSDNTITVNATPRYRYARGT